MSFRTNVRNLKTLKLLESRFLASLRNDNIVRLLRKHYTRSGSSCRFVAPPCVLSIASSRGLKADLRSVISIKAFFLAACQSCFLTFVSVFRRSVSDPFPYLSCRPCLPLRLSFSCCQKYLLAEWFLLQPQLPRRVAGAGCPG